MGPDRYRKDAPGIPICAGELNLATMKWMIKAIPEAISDPITMLPNATVQFVSSSLFKAGMVSSSSGYRF
jgi:hypothetical protein